MLNIFGNKSFVIKKGVYGATAELTMVDNSFVKPFLQIDVEGIWYYFNRLFVNKKIRDSGMATQLMWQVVNWADKNNINILNEVNPYGDLDMTKLIKFYERFGFVKLNDNRYWVLMRRVS